MVPFLGDDPLANEWQVDYTELLPLWKGKYNRHSGYEFAFHAHDASAKTTICELTECRNPHNHISHHIASDQGTCFTTKEV